MLRKSHFIIKFEARHISLENFDRSFLDLLHARIRLRIRLARNDPNELTLVAENVKESAEDNRIIVVVRLENVKRAPEWNTAVEVHLQAALVGVSAEARKADRLFHNSAFGFLCLRVDDADHAVPSERVLRDYVFPRFKRGNFGPVGLVPIAEESMGLEVLLDAGNRIKDSPDNFSERAIRHLLHFVVHVVLNHLSFFSVRGNVECGCDNIGGFVWRQSSL